MSIQLRVRYQFRYFLQFLYSLRVPVALTGSAAKVTVTGLVIVLFMGYIAEVGKLTTGGYEIAALEKKMVTLKNETKKLNTELASFQSINSVKKRVESRKMIPVSRIDYVNIADSAMAQR